MRSIFRNSMMAVLTLAFSAYAAEATTVIVGAPDAATGCGMLRPDKWPDAPVTLQLERGVTLAGKVFDQHGKAAPSVRVQVEPAMPTTHPATQPKIIQLAQPLDAATAHRYKTGIIQPIVEEDVMAQEGSPSFYQGYVRAKTDKDDRFKIPSLFPGCYVIATFAVPGEALRYQNVTLGGVRMELRLGADSSFWQPESYQLVGNDIHESTKTWNMSLAPNPQLCRR